ncbi:uncharacterized protein BKA55DRAFT_571820 [Fusarium redolens]|uniref:Uncharacterized protein n=1 Tax=Fusarium redolens TaxID=48865 RepID=A0A9P9K380_FUSRE|nr:uncharacterized protein BKA55DRAFT_571820 [Fusarium redolens]KAH7247437.1 hypothetical protein BKA55DRAFT_571820 [Fusarium redolens]
MNIEAIVAILTLVVALPPTVYIINKWYKRARNRTPLLPSTHSHRDMRPVRRQSRLLYSMTDQAVILGLQLEEGMLYE